MLQAKYREENTRLDIEEKVASKFSACGFVSGEVGKRKVSSKMILTVDN